MADIPTLDALKAWLGLDPTDTTDDVVLQESLDAAVAAQAAVCFYPTDGVGTSTYPAELRDAAFIRAQRLAARRNSPEGVVGVAGADGDFVAARVPSYDNDVLQLEGPYRKIPVA